MLCYSCSILKIKSPGYFSTGGNLQMLNTELEKTDQKNSESIQNVTVFLTNLHLYHTSVCNWPSGAFKRRLYRYFETLFVVVQLILTCINIMVWLYILDCRVHLNLNQTHFNLQHSLENYMYKTHWSISRRLLRWLKEPCYFLCINQQS